MYVVADNSRLVGLKVVDNRCAEPFSIADIETSTVERAFDYMAIQIAFVQKSECVCADVIRREIFAIDIINRDVPIADPKSQNLPRC